MRARAASVPVQPAAGSDGTPGTNVRSEITEKSVGKVTVPRIGWQDHGSLPCFPRTPRSTYPLSDTPSPCGSSKAPDEARVHDGVSVA